MHVIRLSSSFPFSFSLTHDNKITNHKTNKYAILKTKIENAVEGFEPTTPKVFSYPNNDIYNDILTYRNNPSYTSMGIFYISFDALEY